MPDNQALANFLGPWVPTHATNMSDPSPIVTPESPSDPLVYRPVSVPAILSLVLATVCAVVVIGLGVSAYKNQTPLLLKEWMLIFPLISLVIGLLAWQQIVRSEGTRAGLIFAKLGAGVSLFTGLGYAAFLFATSLAVTMDVDLFAKNWFKKIQDGKLNHAFLDTREPARRKIDKPDDQTYMDALYRGRTRKGPLDYFEEHDLVRVIRRGGAQAELQALGVKSLEYDPAPLTKGYVVEQNFRITTPEGAFDFLVVVRSRENKTDGSRGWEIAWDRIKLTAAAPKPLGETLAQWTGDGKEFAVRFLVKRTRGYQVLAYLDTLPRDKRKRLRTEFEARSAVARLGVGLLPVSDEELAMLGFMEGYKDFAQGKLVSSEEFRASPDDLVKKIPVDVKEQFTQLRQIIIQPAAAGTRERIRSADTERGIVQIEVETDIWVVEKAGTMPKYRCDALLVVESQPGPISSEREPGWHVVALELKRGGPPEDDRQGGGQRRMGGR